MPTRRDIRRLAMQILYQLDLRGSEDAPAIEEMLVEGPDPKAVQTEAFALAMAAWEMRTAADALAAELAPDWPTHRQPPLDRSLLRLGYFELATGRAPTQVVINEVVELAKEYCAENSPAFLNGVLDPVASRLAGGAAGMPSPALAPPKAPADAWLADAVDKASVASSVGPMGAEPVTPPSADMRRTRVRKKAAPMPTPEQAAAAQAAAEQAAAAPPPAEPAPEPAAEQTQQAPPAGAAGKPEADPA